MSFFKRLKKLIMLIRQFWLGVFCFAHALLTLIFLLYFVFPLPFGQHAAPFVLLVIYPLFSFVLLMALLWWFTQTGQAELQGLRRRLDKLGLPHTVAEPSLFAASSQTVLLRLCEPMMDEFAKQRAQLELIHNLEEKLGLAFWEWQVASQQIHLSPGWARLAGIAPEELDTDFDSFSRHLHPQEKNRVMARMSAHLYGEVAYYQSMHRLQHREGYYSWIRDAGFLQRDAAGEVERVCGFSLRVDTEKQLLDTLALLAQTSFIDRESFVHACLTQLRHLYQVNYLLVSLFNARHENQLDSLALWHDGDWQAAIHYHLSDFIGFNALPGGQRAINREAVLTARLIYREAMQVYSGSLLNKQGAEACFCAPLVDSSGKVFGQLLLLHSQPLAMAWWHRFMLDVYAQRLSQELSPAKEQQRQEQIKQAQTAPSICHLSGNFSQEWRVALSGILSDAELLLMSGQLDAEQAQRVNAIHGNSENLLHRLSNLHDFIRLGQRDLALNKQDFSLPTLLQNTQRLMDKLLAAHKELAFKMECPPQLPQALHGDASRLQQMWLNLLRNAVQAAPDGIIRFQLSVKDEETPYPELRFEVQDGRITPTEEDLRQLQHALQHPDEAVLHDAQGLVPDLLITQQLARLMDGELAFKPLKPQGLSVWFRVRLSQTLFKQANASPSDRPSAARILVAEDSPINQAVIRRMLHRLGYQADVADNGQQVLTHFLSHHYDLILMDCEMPELDGYEATELIRQHEHSEQLPHMPIIALTAYALPEHRERTRLAGMDEHISKPVTLKKLRDTLHKWLPETPRDALPDSLRDKHAPALMPHENTQAPIDERTLDALRKVLGENIHTIIEQYLRYAPQQLSALQSALQQEQAEAVRQKAHQFKGESVQIGAVCLADLCKQIELLAKEQKLAELPVLLKRLEAESERVAEFLRNEVTS